MTATSVSVSVTVWREANALNSSNGQLMLDVAEMDDLSASALMALLFALVPVLHNNPEANWLPILANAAAIFTIKTLFFAAFCFFFIGIGLSIDLTALPIALGWGAMLLTAAVLGKLIGVAIPVVITDTWNSAVLLGLSMVPRAEIMMIIMQRGLHLGAWAVSSHLFSAMVVVSAATTILIPLLLRRLLQRWPQTEMGSSL